MHQFDFTRKDLLMDKMVVHLNLLGPSVEYGVFRKVDTVEVVAINRCPSGHFHMQMS